MSERTSNPSLSQAKEGGSCCGVSIPRMSLSEEADLAILAKALGHPARVRILRILIERAGCISKDLSSEIPLAASTISQHLTQLKNAGLVQGEVDGPRICYCVDPVILARLKYLISCL